MKIISVRLKNINSLKDEHLVDFTADPLGSAGLFVITGPTGSGKSTILDAITLALYGRIPRIKQKIINNKLVEQEGIILTRHTNDCFTEVVYEVKGKRYRSSWTMSRNRNKKLNDRKQELYDIEADCILSDKNDSVIEKNQEIIGLNYEQFVQSLILAQGKFAKLLQSGRSERNALLESITGTEIYREIGKRVFDKSSKALRLVEDQKMRMKGIELLSEAEVAECQAEIDKNEPIRIGFEKDRSAVHALITVKNNLVELSKKWGQNVIDFEALKVREELLQNERIQLLKYDEMAVFRSEVNAIEQEEKAIQLLKDEIVVWTNETKEINRSNQELLAQAARLLGGQVTEQEMIDRLTAFKKRVETDQKRIEDEERTLIGLQKEIQKSLMELGEEGLAIEFSTLSNDLLHSEHKKVIRAIEDLNVRDVDELKTKREALRKSYKPALELCSNRKDFDRNQAVFIEKSEGLKQKNSDLAAARIKREELFVSLKKATEDRDKAQKDFEKMRSERGLDALRLELVPGEHCPLCGSLEHPYHEVYEEKLLSTFEDLLVKANDIYSRNNADFILIEGKISSLAKDLLVEEGQRTKLEGIQNDTKKLLLQQCLPFGWDLNAPLSEWDEALNKMNTQIEALEQGEKEFKKRNLLEAVLLEFEKTAPLNALLTELRTELAKNYAGHDIEKDTQEIIETRKENNVKLSERIQRVKVAENDADGRTKALNVALKNLLIRLNEKGISDLVMYRSNILDEALAQQMRLRLNQIDTLRTALETTKASLVMEIQEQQKKDDLSKDIATLSADFESLSESIRSLSELIGTLKEKLNRNEQDKVRLQDSQTVLDQLKKDQVLWGRMNELIGEKTGNRFANFVQDLTFEQLIAFGNKRLESFSDRYILTIPSNADSGDLNVMDTYMGNSKRSIFSLSGGETFKLSLALALGLSDLAARKVEIESLFIDEGFGSLDPDSLEEAISLLEDIQNKGNKSIGIISHVSELKDRIGTKVKLVPQGSGYSKIVVE